MPEIRKQKLQKKDNGKKQLTKFKSDPGSYIE